MSISAGKRQRLQSLSTPQGVIAAAAMDQRGSLENLMAAVSGRGLPPPEQMTEFKCLVVKHLSPYASAMLLDTEFGMPAVPLRAPHCGLLLAYEKFGYDLNVPGRIPELLPYLSVRRLVEMGAQAIKILLHYTPFEDPRINDVKHAWVERIGAECAANDAPFFLEFIGYDETGAPMNTVEYARRKPEIVTRSMEEFSKPQYGVDVLKVEFPVNLQFVAGTRAYREGGTPAYSRAEAREAFQRAASVTGLPFIYLSAGVCDSEFVESLELAADAATEFSGVLCGRATWQDGVPLYVRQGAAALEEWLGREGVRNIQAVNAALRAAKPWWSRPAAQSGPGAA